MVMVGCSVALVLDQIQLFVQNGGYQALGFAGLFLDLPAASQASPHNSWGGEWGVDCGLCFHLLVSQRNCSPTAGQKGHNAGQCYDASYIVILLTSV